MHPRETAADVAQSLEQELGDRLQAVLLYGSLARGEFNESFSDINLLILLDRADTALLGRMAKLAAGWPERRIRPLLLEEREWRRSADAFAIELLEMKEAHELLAGSDPVEAAVVERSAARLQAERELRTLIIQLHNGMVRFAADPETLGELLIAALPSFTTYLRTALRLAGRTPPNDTAGVIAEGTALVGAPAQGLLDTLEARLRGKPWKVSLTDPVLERYAAAAECTARYVDTLEEGFT